MKVRTWLSVLTYWLKCLFCPSGLTDQFQSSWYKPYSNPCWSSHNLFQIETRQIHNYLKLPCTAKSLFHSQTWCFIPWCFNLHSHVWKLVHDAQTLLTPSHMYFYTSPITNVLKKISFFLYGDNEFLMNFLFYLSSQIRNHLLHTYNIDRFYLEAIEICK